ncbi:MAG: A24 family peptidase [Pseudomonadota bacterium]|nr:A24 family peptidase [Pseudomonadota bacterium]
MLIIVGGIFLGLIVGSFLNVLAYRLPIMIENKINDTDSNKSKIDLEAFNLITPSSRCPICNYKIQIWQNIPVISWLLLKGKCHHCEERISLRYPLVEILTGLLSGLIVWKFGITPAALAGLFLIWILISLSLIDLEHQILPDRLNFMLLWSGITLALFYPLEPNLPYPDLQSSIIGAMLGYLSLWSVYWLFRFFTGKEGIGYGDFKLLAALGAWLGWQMLPLIILLSASIGTLIGLIIIKLKVNDRDSPIPFGPFLSMAGLISLLWGEDILTKYLNNI